MPRESFIPNDARFTEAERVAAGHRPQHGGQVHHPPPDRPLRGAGADGRVRARRRRRRSAWWTGSSPASARATTWRAGQSTFMVEMSETSAILHNAGAAEPGAARRDRPRHLDLRRRRDRLGGDRAPARPGRLQDDVRHPLPRADAAARAARSTRGTTTSRCARPGTRSSSSTGSSRAAPTGPTASTSPSSPGCPDEVVRRAREVLGTLEGEHRMVPGAPAGARAIRGSSPSSPTRRRPTRWSRSCGRSTSNALTPLEALNRLADFKRRAEDRR